MATTINYQRLLAAIFPQHRRVATCHAGRCSFTYRRRIIHNQPPADPRDPSGSPDRDETGCDESS